MSKDKKGPSETSGGRGYRKLAPIIEDLDKIAREYGAGGSTTEMKGLDGFDKEKRDLQSNLVSVKKMVDELTEMKRGLGEGEKDRNSLDLANRIRKRLADCSKSWEVMKKALEKEVAKGAKSKVPAKVLESRQEALTLLGQEIMLFSERASYVKEVKSTVEIGAVSRARQERLEKKKERKRGRKGRKTDTPATATDDDGEPATGDDDDGLDGQSGAPAPVSAQQQAFMDRKDENDQEIDQALDMVSAALGDLKGMAVAINKELKVQEVLLGEVEVQMDKTTEKLHTQNMKLQEIMDAQGGVTRWCPVLICGIILLALAGYIFKMI